MFHGNCENCGIDILHEKALKLGGTYWITTSGKWFCSNRCRDQYVARNTPSQPITFENERVASYASDNDTIDNDEMQRLRIDREREEETQRILKGQRFRDKGRPFAAWLTELNPVYTTCIILGILVSFAMGGILPIIGSITLIVSAFLLIREAVKKS